MSNHLSFFSFLSNITIGFRILFAGSSPHQPNWYPVPYVAVEEHDREEVNNTGAANNIYTREDAKKQGWDVNKTDREEILKEELKETGDNLDREERQEEELEGSDDSDDNNLSSDDEFWTEGKM